MGIFMEEFLAYIIKNLVANPAAVEIRSQTENDTIKMEIRVASEDLGKVIGRKGNTIHAIRTIVRRISSRVKKKILIDLYQPANSDKDFSSYNLNTSTDEESEDSCASERPISHCCSSENI